MKSDLEKRFKSILEEEKHVSGIYNKPFIVGVLFTVAVFIISNSISYFIAYNGHLSREAKGRLFSNFSYYPWGFPFTFCINEFECSPENLVLNTIVIVFFSFLFGFLFRFIWSKISHRFVKVN